MCATRSFRLGPVETQQVRDVTNALFASASPGHALVELASCKDNPQAGAFARYAGLILADASVERLSGMPFLNRIMLDGPQDGRLARVGVKGPIPQHARTLVAGIEDAVSRIIALRDAVEDAALSAVPSAGERIFITFQGVDRIPDEPTNRSALVPLPPIALTEKPTLSFFNELDWRILDHVASNGRAVFQNSLRPNLHQSVMGAYASNDSDWDVRTRLASILDGLEISPRTVCRFDCDVERQTVYAVFAAPGTSDLPRWIAPEGEMPLKPLGDSARQAQMAYTLRLACLVACGCFGSGHHIQTVHLAAHDPNGKPLVECAFDRDEFVRTVLAAIDSGKLADPELRFDPDSIASLMTPRWLSRIGAAPLGARPPDFDERPNRILPKEDKRPLPARIGRLFGAGRICDLDATYFGSHSELIDEALADSADSVITAIAELEELAHRAEAATVPPDDNANSRPLYYGSPFSRIATPLLADEISVGMEAQEFLRGSLEDGRNDTRTAPKASFFRAPSALFHAYMGLSDLYQRMGDFAGAAANADRCIALGPTTASAYFRKADVLAEQTRYAEAANVLLAGLRFGISKKDCALLYYHLGLVLWRMGRESDAAAVQVYASSLTGDFAEKARAVVSSLRKRPASPVIVHGSARAAAAEMRRNRIPIMPNDDANALVAQAALGLSCANAPEAAIPFTDVLATMLSADRVIISACRSIRNGTNR